MRLFYRVLSIGIFGCFVTAGAFAANSDQVTVQGLVKFERRATVVPQVICSDGEPCFKSKPYWIMVLNEDGMRYELSQPYGMGSVTPPQSIEVAGLHVQDGNRVRVVAHVEPIASNYAILTQVKDIQLLSPFAYGYKTQEIFPARMSSGWVCHSVSSEFPEYKISLWYGSGPSSTQPQQQFRMSLEYRQSREDEFRPMAVFNDLTQRVVKRELVFDGASHYHMVALKIRQSAGTVFNTPGVFSMFQISDGTGRGAVEQMLLDLKCTQN